MIISILALFAAAQAAPQTVPRDNTVVVTGKRLADLQSALDACIARNCPPDQEIDAALALVERQFVDGDYAAARKAAAASIGRNKRHASTYPVPVSDLQRSYARIGAHLGDPNIYRSATTDSLSALKAGLPADDIRVLGAQIELADMHSRTANPDLARSIYRGVVKKGRETSRPAVVGMGLLRLAILASSTGKPDREAEAALAELASDPKMARFATAAKLLKARAAAKRGDTGAIDRMIAELPRNGAWPTLVYAPPMAFEATAGGRSVDVGGGNVANLGQVDAVEKQWIDVGFWIAPDGKVGDVAILRQSPQLAGEWPKAVLGAVGGRRYSPFRAETDDPGMYRVERYSFTADYVTLTGSRVRTRSTQPKIEMIDLTDDVAPPATPASGAF